MPPYYVTLAIGQQPRLLQSIEAWVTRRLSIRPGKSNPELSDGAVPCRFKGLTLGAGSSSPQWQPSNGSAYCNAPTQAQLKLKSKSKVADSNYEGSKYKAFNLEQRLQRQTWFGLEVEIQLISQNLPHTCLWKGRPKSFLSNSCSCDVARISLAGCLKLRRYCMLMKMSWPSPRKAAKQFVHYSQACSCCKNCFPCTLWVTAKTCLNTHHTTKTHDQQRWIVIGRAYKYITWNFKAALFGKQDFRCTNNKNIVNAIHSSEN